jgi:hypothetical protein
MDWGVARSDESAFGGIPFTLLVRSRRACGIDRRGVLLTAVFGQQTEDSIDVVAWVDPAIVDVSLLLRPVDGLYLRQAQSYRGRLSVVRAGSLPLLAGTIAHGDAAFNVRLELVGALP